MTHRAAIQHCRRCGAASQPYAVFCLNCGEADFAAGPAGALLERATTPQARRGAGLRRWGAPLLAGLVLLGLLGEAVFRSGAQLDFAPDSRYLV